MSRKSQNHDDEQALPLFQNMMAEERNNEEIMLGEPDDWDDDAEAAPTLHEQARATFRAWYDRASNGGSRTPKGTIGGALVVLERLKNDYDLDVDMHTATGGAQIIGASGSAVKQILAQHGETRPFAKEGGRTNRGLRGAIRDMLGALEPLGLDDLPTDERNVLLNEFQSFLVDRVRDFHAQQRMEIAYDRAKSTRYIIHEVLELASATNKGAVAQHLVGAKLQRRFPQRRISNHSYSTADDQLGRPGDFVLGDTVFHVTVAPALPVIEKCRRNVEQDYRVYLLVPEALKGITQNSADQYAPGKIAVESIESFIGQNIEELSAFSHDQLRQEFRALLETYNTRVREVEIDRSMLIAIPQNLQRNEDDQEEQPSVDEW